MMPALVGLGLAAASIGALVWWGTRKPASSPASGGGALPGPENVGPFPDLKVGTVVLIDVAKADLLFVPEPTVAAVVDRILTDRLLVSVALVPPAPPFSGTVPRSAIIRVIAAPPPGVQV